MAGVKTVLKFLPVILFLLPMSHAIAQNKDTLAIYRKIKKTAYKTKVTKLLYHSIFVDPAPAKVTTKPLGDDQRRDLAMTRFNGKIIRHIEIEVLDPFGYSVNDTAVNHDTAVIRGPLRELGNRVHTSTRDFVIRNFLLFKEGEVLNTFLVAESERILRTAAYINDARIFIEPLKGFSRDSVDIKVLVLDKWSVVVPVVVTSSTVRVTFRDRNFLGLGQQFEQSYSYNVYSSNYEYNTRYRINNISNTYISSEIYYRHNRDFSQAGIAFDRPFYSPLARWAGGVSVNRSWSYFNYIDTNQTERRHDLDFYSYDVWGAKAFTPPLRSLNNPNNNIIVGLRYLNTHFLYRPPTEIDSNQVNTHSKLYLGSIGYTFQNFYKDQYIFRFGANEDIPEGANIQFTYGIAHNEVRGRMLYTGLEVSKGRHVEDFGYISGYAACGTFYSPKMTNNTTVQAGVTYFSDLQPNYIWNFRQFVKLKTVYGINKQPYERIGFSREEMYGLVNDSLRGTAKTILNLETVMYTPYNIIGFKFAPVLLLGFGLLQDDNNTMLKSPVYQSYALGILIRNENLLVSSFEITAGFYPSVPGSDEKRWKLNPLMGFTLRVRSFAIGRPEIVWFE